MRRLLPPGIAAIVALVVAAVAMAEGPPERRDTRSVMFVGNNWDGTADVVDARTFQRLGQINTIPDRAERMREISADPARLGVFLAIRALVGEGHDQFTDDIFTTHDGRLVAVSRPSFADVVGIDLRTQRIAWRFAMEGSRSDHMAVSPDGTKLLVSDATASKVHELELRTGRKTGEFGSGDTPHESNYSPDGKRIYHASIGLVYTPADRQPLEELSKGKRFFQVVDAESLQVLKRWDIGDKLAEAGYPGMSSAVRPMTLSPDERFAYLQVSFLHGFVEFDLREERVRRVAQLPLSEQARTTPREGYLLDSAHHGLAMNPGGTRLCAAGTISDYAAIVERDTFAARLVDVGRKPYWSTNGPEGRTCWVSVSGDDRVVVIDYETARPVARIPVGDHPQRVRAAAVADDVLADLPGGPERFALNVSHKTGRRGIGILRDRVAVGCRPQGSERVRLDRCAVRLRASARGRMTTIGKAALARPGSPSLRVTVRLNRSGRALLRRRPRGFGVTIVATGEDALGREQTVRKPVRLRRGRS